MKWQTSRSLCSLAITPFGYKHNTTKANFYENHCVHTGRETLPVYPSFSQSFFSALNQAAAAHPHPESERPLIVIAGSTHTHTQQPVLLATLPASHTPSRPADYNQAQNWTNISTTINHTLLIYLDGEKSADEEIGQKLEQSIGGKTTDRLGVRRFCFQF